MHFQNLKGGKRLAIRILEVFPGSAAEHANICAGEYIIQINGEDVLDEIDYQALIQRSRLKILLRNDSGAERTVILHKAADAPLGLTLDERIILRPRECKNHCIFCFVDQLPPGMRKSLYVRDDDWRLSLMMGNFVTLTNVDDQEFERILKRKASPLYISVHATDPDVRIRMLKNPNAGRIMDRLKSLKEHQLRFHCQVVLCPGINDGSILHQTIVDLAGLYPSALSLAIVPVGLTGHREHLSNLRTFNKEEARSLIYDLELIQSYYLKTLGTRFVYASDELYCIAELPVPPEEAYEGYAQIENGVGMIRQMAQECQESWPVIREELAESDPRQRSVLIPTGVSAFPFIQKLITQYASERIHVSVIPVENHFFGESVTVTGLIVGQDLIDAVQGKNADEILISASMLRENTDSFLDNITLDGVREKVGIPIRVVQNNGESFLRALYGLEEQ